MAVYQNGVFCECLFSLKVNRLTEDMWVNKIVTNMVIWVGWLVVMVVMLVVP